MFLKVYHKYVSITEETRLILDVFDVYFIAPR